MGLTGHLALAFEPAEEAKVLAMLSGEGEGDAAILYQPKFGLVREDHYIIHRVLEAVGESWPELAGRGTPVIGTKPVAEAGMGVQYLYSADDVRAFAAAYGKATSESVRAAVERVCPEFDLDPDGSQALAIPPMLETIRQEIGLVARNGWAMVAGMY
ncbi:hypothetical protein J4558_00450 [Leptolyngbya sp. 15MV]|nr:hypothetical protein J4558_00450 [Leptolyngbya sp. 15MV]